MIVKETLDINFIIQSTIVGVIILAACIWIIWKIVKKQKDNSGSCHGCGLADTCNKRNKNDGKNSDLQ